MSKKGPRSDAFHRLTGSLSEEVIAQYLELAYYVREKELERRRAMERAKAAVKRKKAAEAAARRVALCAALGIEPPEPKKNKGKGRKKKQNSKSKSAKGKSKSAKSKSNPAKGKTEAAKGKAEAARTTAPAAEGEAAAREVVPAAGTETTSPGADAAAETKAIEDEAASDSAKATTDESKPAASENDTEDDSPTWLEVHLGANSTGRADEPVAKKNPSKSRNAKPITREDILKLIVADHLGYLDKVRADGWGGLNCAESGRVGGMMTRRMKLIEKGGSPF